MSKLRHTGLIQSLVGGSVLDCTIGFGIRFRVGIDIDIVTICFGTNINFFGLGGTTSVLDHRYPTQAAPLLALIGSKIADASVTDDGALHLAFGSGHQVQVAPDADYEAWEVVADGGSRAVSMPGGEVAVWEAP